jgi:hypothetical protein
MDFYRHYWARILSLVRSDQNPEVYLQENLPGYLASQAVVETLIADGKQHMRVLTLPPVDVPFYYRKANIMSVGDFFGPASYLELYDEIERGDCLPYLTRLRIGAVVVEQPETYTGNWRASYVEFITQLKRYDFREHRVSGSNLAIFLRSDVKPGQRLVPVQK